MLTSAVSEQIDKPVCQEPPYPASVFQTSRIACLHSYRPTCKVFRQFKDFGKEHCIAYLTDTVASRTVAQHDFKNKTVDLNQS